MYYRDSLENELNSVDEQNETNIRKYQQEREVTVNFVRVGLVCCEWQEKESICII